MKNLLKVIVFSLGVLLFYTLFADRYIPAINPEPPPVEAFLDLGAMTMDQFIALGEKIFNGKGTCTLCHNPIGGRAPLLDQAGKIAEERLKDPRYKGKAKNGGEYLQESMVEPSAFVVAGFGVTGTNDTVSPMPVVTAGAIGLKDFEVGAVIAYLQNKAGVPVTVELPKERPAAGAEAQGPAPTPAKTPEEVITKYGCGACHKIAGQVGPIGPDLTKIGAKRDREYLRRSILDPNKELSKDCPTGPCPPGMMPQDYGSKMLAGEIEILVDYMAKSR